MDEAEYYLTIDDLDNAHQSFIKAEELYNDSSDYEGLFSVYYAAIDLAGKNKIDDVLKLAVKRMLPGGPLAKKQLSKLKIYKGEKHPHEVQNPTIINFKELNKKNTINI